MTTNDLLEYFILDSSIGISFIKEEFLPGNIQLELSDIRFLKVININCESDIILLDEILCTSTMDSCGECSYQFTEFGKKIMNKVVIAYLENIIKSFNYE